jgi:putative ABC transport system ATP-binding protein
VVAEATASLGRMRSADGGARLEPWARLRGLLRQERRTLWIAVVYSVVIGLLSLVAPVAVQSLVNTIAFGSSRQPLLVLTLFVLGALGFSTAMNGARAFVIEVMQRSIFARVASDVTWRLVRVRADAFDRFFGPELVNRFFDTVTVQKSAALLLIDGLSIVMQTTVGLLLLAVYHPWLLVFDILLVAAMVGIVFGLGRGAVTTSIKESKAKYAVEAWLEQIAAHLVTFKSAGGAALAFQRSHDLLEHYLGYRAAHFRILIRQIVGAFALQAAGSAALLGIGGWLVINRQLTLGQLVASELVVTLMLSAFTKFGKQLEVFYDLSAAVDKLGDLIDLPLEHGGGTAVMPGGGAAAMHLRDVELRYDGAAQPALRLAALDIPAGARLGITGGHGSGKSTLADVLFGLRRPGSGVVLLDGIDTRDVALSDWRTAVALVRHVELFSGTVAENVRLGADVSDDRVVESLRRVGLLDELRALPDGLATVVHPHGRPLSHRQACRIMLARALVRQPRLLIIDGLLDQLDRGDGHHELLDVLFGPHAPWTLVCITERPDLLERCSGVVRLENGVAGWTPGPEAR